MAAPLTHHEILRHVAPLTRSGLRVDLAGSDRAGRVVLFMPQPLGGADGLPAPGLAQFRLHLPEPGPGARPPRLERRLLLHPDDAEPLVADLAVSGTDLAAMQALLAAQPAAAQFHLGTDHAIAFDRELQLEGPPRLVAARARFGALRLSATLPRLSGYPAQLEMQSAPGAPGGLIELPEDLLAVLGRGWSALSRYGAAWRATLSVPGRREPARSQAAEARLVRTVEHLADTLARPPAEFHERQRAARWRVAARDSVPLLVVLGLIGGALAVPRMALAQDSVFRMLIFNAPPLLVALGVCLREIPRIALPRWPRAPGEPGAASWWSGAGGGGP